MQNPTVEENEVLANAIANQMGVGYAETWTKNKNISWWGFGINEPATGRSLWFRWNHGKWEVSVHLPNDKQNQSVYYDEKQFPKPSCNLSATKSAEQLVKDVRRKIIPEYDLVFNEVARSIAIHNNNYDEHDALKARVEQTIGKKFPTKHNGPGTQDDMYFDKIQYKYDFEVKVSGNNIEIKCCFKDAEAGLKMLKQIQDQVPQPQPE